MGWLGKVRASALYAWISFARRTTYRFHRDLDALVRHLEPVVLGLQLAVTGASEHPPEVPQSPSQLIREDTHSW